MKSNRVYLRAFEPDDYKTTIEWRNNPRITNQLGGVFLCIRSTRKEMDRGYHLPFC